MDRPIISIHNADGEETQRPMNDKEYAQWQIDFAAAEAAKTAEEEAKVKRAQTIAKLQALGLDEADLKALGL